MSASQTRGNDVPSDPSQTFTDRDEIVKYVRHLLYSAQPGDLRLICIKGSSGTGKTTLIHYLAHQIGAHQNWFPYRINFAKPAAGYVDILDRLAEGLKKCVSSEDWKRYIARLSSVENHLSKRKIMLHIPQYISARGQSKVENANQSVRVENQFRTVDQVLQSAKISVLRDLAGNMKRPLCLFIDNYERLNEIDEHLGNWFCHEILPDIAQSSPQPFVAVVCGWEWPERAADLTKRFDLMDFTPVQVQEYLEKQALLPNPVDAEAKDLVHAFVQVTEGYPMALALASELFSSLDSEEQKRLTFAAHEPQFKRELRMELRRKMQVEFLDERLLDRIPVPYNPLLKWSPILRFFNQEALQILLDAVSDVTEDERIMLRAGEYERFLRYPFVQQNVFEDQIIYDQRSLHEIVRWVGLGALRIHRDKVHRIQRILAEYYQERAEDIRAESNPDDATPFQLRRMSEEEFRARLEYLYHALQITDLEPKAFEQWENLMEQAINGWQQQRAVQLLEVIRQLERDGDGEIPLSREHHNRYESWYGRFLAQGAHWRQARAHFERTILHRKSEEDIADLATTFNYIGLTYSFEEKWQDALSFFEKSLSLREQMEDALAMAISLNNIAAVCYGEGDLEQALDYCKRAQSILEQVDDSVYHFELLDNIGLAYQQQGKLEEALDYYKQALNRKTQAYAPLDTADSLMKVGVVYSKQGRTGEAIQHFTQALTLYKGLGCSFESEMAGALENLITCCVTELENLADCYSQLGEDKKSAEYLGLAEQIHRKISKVI